MKKAIKIALIILLIASMLFVLTGCGKEEKVSTNEGAAENKEIVLEEEVLSADTETLSEDTEKEETKTEISMGKWIGDTYKNEFLGIEFVLPQGWERVTDEEIAAMMNIGAEMLNDDQKIGAELAKLTSAYYMSVKNPNTGDNLTILTEKPTMNVTEEFYLNQLKTQLEAVESMNYEIGEISKENVSGKEFKSVIATASVSGIEVGQKYFVRKMDKYFVCIIVTSTSGANTIDTIMRSFK